MMNEMQELDCHLDDYIEFIAQEDWRSYRLWTIVWVVMLAFIWAGSLGTLWLAMSGSGIWPVLLGVVLGCSFWFGLATVKGGRAHRRWAAAQCLQRGEGL